MTIVDRISALYKFFWINFAFSKVEGQSLQKIQFVFKHLLYLSNPNLQSQHCKQMFLKNSTLYDKYLILPGIRRLDFVENIALRSWLACFFVFSVFTIKSCLYLHQTYTTLPYRI